MTVLQRTTRYSPFFLVFGRSPSYTLKSPFFSASVPSEAPTHDQYISQLAHCRQKHACATKFTKKPGSPAMTRPIAVSVSALRTRSSFGPFHVHPYFVKNLSTDFLGRTSPLKRLLQLISASHRRRRDVDIVRVS